LFHFMLLAEASYSSASLRRISTVREYAILESQRLGTEFFG
jgi:hypothetical protein